MPFKPSIKKPGKVPFTEKVCPTCGILKLRSEYYKKGPSVTSDCKPCNKKRTAEYARKKQYNKKYAERMNDWRRMKVASDPDWVESRRQTKKKRYDKVKDRENARRRKHWLDPNSAAHGHNLRRDVRTHTPPWADFEKIARIYATCPSGFHVDHIIPILGLIDGRPVSGLHVDINLQHLTAQENHKKYNRVSEEDLN
jgi:hypothetical protein